MWSIGIIWYRRVPIECTAPFFYSTVRNMVRIPFDTESFSRMRKKSWDPKPENRMIYRSASRLKTGHRIWLFFRLVYYNNLPIFVFTFKNRIFFVNTQQESADFGWLFLSAVRPRVYWRIVGIFFCPIFYDLPLQIAFFKLLYKTFFSRTLRLLEPLISYFDSREQYRGGGGS